MGEARKRAEPDFIFVRDEADGFVLAGQLITDIEKSDVERFDREEELITHVIRGLISTQRRHRRLIEQAGVWRSSTRPRRGLTAPFPPDRLTTRAERCITVPIRVDDRDVSEMHFDHIMLAPMAITLSFKT